MSAPGRIAGAPISWGVCEVPGWGHQLPAARVLSEMREVGIVATEFGPEGFLPSEPAAMARTLAGHGLEAVGGFTPLLLHVPGADPVPEVQQLLEGYAASGARTMVLSAVTGLAGYDSRPALDDTGWATLLRNLDRVAAVAAEHGVQAVLHPHVGTMVERGDEVQRVLEGSSVALCLDTGHLLIGGTDPAELARQAPGRIAHAHLKDVDLSVAVQVQDGRLSYTDGVRGGMYRPLGTGDVDVASIVGSLSAHGYDGWYVMEQDTVLVEDPVGRGPLDDVAASAEHLRSVLARSAPAAGLRP